MAKLFTLEMTVWVTTAQNAEEARAEIDKWLAGDKSAQVQVKRQGEIKQAMESISVNHDTGEMSFTRWDYP